ncbi:MAG: hypothetical protein KAX37_05865 [Opitutaceae bacterium]|nr:hypothetical protein [Opitutaceae bacterium]
MKFVPLCLFLSAAAIAAGAAQIGQTYSEVIAKQGQPSSRIETGPIRILRYPRQIVKLQDDIVVEISVPPRPRHTEATAAATTAGAPAKSGHLEIAAIRLKRARAEDRIRAIVNQPPPGQVRTVRMRVQTTQGAWYPEAAGVPNFASADVRATQQKNYDGKGYLAAGAEPGTVYLGDDLEYNPLLSYYYANRTAPKKKLKPEEMEEINALFRTIAECDRQLKSPTPPSTEATPAVVEAPSPTTPAPATAQAGIRRERTTDGT